MSYDVVASLILVDVHPGYIESVEGRLKARREVDGVMRRNGDGGLALLVSLEEPEQLTRFMTNQIGLTPGVESCRKAPGMDFAKLNRLAEAMG